MPLHSPFIKVYVLRTRAGLHRVFALQANNLILIFRTHINKKKIMPKWHTWPLLSDRYSNILSSEILPSQAHSSVFLPSSTTNYKQWIKVSTMLQCLALPGCAVPEFLKLTPHSLTKSFFSLSASCFISSLFRAVCCDPHSHLSKQPHIHTCCFVI